MNQQKDYSTVPSRWKIWQLGLLLFFATLLLPFFTYYVPFETFVTFHTFEPIHSFHSREWTLEDYILSYRMKLGRVSYKLIFTLSYVLLTPLFILFARRRMRKSSLRIAYFLGLPLAIAPNIGYILISYGRIPDFTSYFKWLWHYESFFTLLMLTSIGSALLFLRDVYNTRKVLFLIPSHSLLTLILVSLFGLHNEAMMCIDRGVDYKSYYDKGAIDYISNFPDNIAPEEILYCSNYSRVFANVLMGVKAEADVSISVAGDSKFRQRWDQDPVLSNEELKNIQNALQTFDFSSIKKSENGSCDHERISYPVWIFPHEGYAFDACEYDLPLKKGPFAALIHSNAWNRRALYISKDGLMQPMQKYLSGPLGDPDMRDFEGTTMLMDFSKWGSREVVEMLLRYGADVNATSERGKTALMEAAKIGHLKIVKILLKHGADLSHNQQGLHAAIIATRAGHHHVAEFLHDTTPIPEPDPVLQPLLFAAIESNNIQLLKKIVASGIDLNQMNDNERVPLQNALCLPGNIPGKVVPNPEIVEFLLKHGADPNRVDLDDSPLSLVGRCVRDVSEKTRAHLAELLIEHGALLEDKKGAPFPLYNAVEYNHPLLVETLLKHGANPNANATYAWHPLRIAAKKGNLKIAKILFRYGADPEMRVLGETPLSIAREHNNEEMIKILHVRSNGGSALKDERNAAQKLLLEATIDHDLATVKKALAEGADPQKALCGGCQTAFNEAIKKCANDFIKEFINHGANPGEDIFDLVRLTSYCPQHREFKYLGFRITVATPPIFDGDRTIKAGVADLQNGNALLIAAANCGAETLKLLLDSSIDPNAENWDGITALQMAAGSCRDDNIEVLRPYLDEKKVLRALQYSKLLQASGRGALSTLLKMEDGWYDLNTISPIDQTPLILAARYGHSKVISVLIEKGADVELINRNGITALMEASHRGNLESVKRLLEAGAQINRESYEFMSPLLYATQAGAYNVVEYLLDHGADIEAKNSAEYTAFLAAAEIGDVELLKLLYAKGADTTVISDGITRQNALEIATSAKHKEAIEYLKTLKTK